MLDTIWKFLPTYIRWPIVFITLFLALPVKIYESGKGIIRSEIQAVTIPMEEKRMIEMKYLRDDIATIKQDTRDIKIHLLNRGK